MWEAVHRRIVDEVEARGPLFHAAFDNLRDLNRRLDANSGLNFGSIVFRQVHSALGGRLKLAVSGGSALPHRVAEFFNDIGIPLLEGYGLTEAAPVLSVARPDEPLQVGAVGRPLNGVEIKLMPATGSIGEIVVHGPNVMAGYYRNEAATAEVLTDGWLHTGDLGRFDDDGRLYIVGRAKEVIVDSGGNNIYIEELEEIYGRSQYVKEMAVVGLKVGQGEQVAALVVPAYARGESRRAVEDRLRTDFDQVGRELSAHKRIRILRFTDAELPRTRTRKIKRADVAATLRRMLDVRPSTTEADASNSEVETWLAEALAAIATEPVNITPETRLIEDLGLDSLALAEIGELIGERASRDIAPEEIADLRTVADLQLLAAQPGGNGRPRMPSYAKFADPYTPRLPAPLKWLGRFAVRGAERALFDGWLKPKILGRGNVPANRNFIVVANHSSHLDFSLVGYALGAIGEDMRVLAAKDYFFNTPARRFLASNFTSLMPFDRERAQLESLEDALAELAQGRSVLMFPEGTRSADGAIHEFKSGAGFLALRSRCDVLPVLIRGTHDVMGKGSLVPRRHPVEVRIGRAITASELREVAASSEGAGAYRKIADLMRTAVVALSGSSSEADSCARNIHRALANSRSHRAIAHQNRARARTASRPRESVTPYDTGIPARRMVTFDSWLIGSANAPTIAPRPTRGERRPSVSVISDELLVGEYPGQADIAWLKDTYGVTAVHNLQDDDDLRMNGLDNGELSAEYDANGIDYVRTPIQDGSADAMAERLEAALHDLARPGRFGLARLSPLQRRDESRADAGDCVSARISANVSRRSDAAREKTARLRTVHDGARRILRAARLQAGQMT